MNRRYQRLFRQILKTSGLLDAAVDSVWRIRHAGMEAGLHRFTPTDEISRQVTAVVLTTGPGPFLSRVMASVQAQSLAPGGVVVIRDVTPFSRACQAALDSVRTPYYVSVDDDMLLHPHCFKRLFFYLAADERCAETVTRLTDPILGRIYGVHMYRTAVVRAIGFHPLDGEKGAERKLIKAIASAGFRSLHLDVVGGRHHPVYSPEDAFWKYKFIGEQAAYYPGKRGAEIMANKLDRLSEYWLDTHADLALFAMAGFIAGITGAEPAVQLDASRPREHPLLRQVGDFLRRRSTRERR